MGTGEIFSTIKSTFEMPSNESTFVVCSPFFKKLPPDARNSLYKLYKNGGWEKFFYNQKHMRNAIEWAQFFRLLSLFLTGYPRDAQNSSQKLFRNGIWKIFFENQKDMRNAIEWTQFCRLLPFFQQATPGTQKKARINCLKIGAGKIFSKLKSTCEMLSNESTFVVCS